MLHRIVLLLLLSGALFAEPTESSVDPFIWLEDIDSTRAMDWVKDHNRTTAEDYKSKPIYDELYQQALTTLNNQSRIPEVSRQGDWLYNYWKDDAHPRGLYRRARVDNFIDHEQADWETVIDMDDYNKNHEGTWVFKGLNCLKPDYQRCLMYLSPGGGDAVVMKEFDVDEKQFIDDGFQLPKAKMRVTWRDRDHLYVATDFGADSMTSSGYPAVVKLWQRGQDLSDAKTLMTVPKESVSVSAFRSGEGDNTMDLIVDGTSFWTNDYYLLLGGEPQKLDLPDSAVVNDIYQDQLVVSLKEDWQFQGQSLKQGMVLLIKPKLLLMQKAEVKEGDWQVFLTPDSFTTIEAIVTSDNSIIVNSLVDVVAQVDVYQPDKEDPNRIWKKSRVEFPPNGAVSLSAVDDKSGDFFAVYESFIKPPTLYHVAGDDLKATAVRQQKPSFDATPYVVKQYFARSTDGTFVPYFIVMNKNLEFNGQNPTHIFSYGGFRNSLTPSYSGSYEALEGAYGKLWLDRGGVFVSANIRGGGEYGPKWHQAAILENKTKSYEDFEAVARDLVERNITSPEHLGIEGRSNGGLLVGATMTRHPELYGAAVIGVPLLDLKRYHKLLAGASWMGEFGNPDKPEDWAFMKKYSPYQNLKKDTDYPATFFFTSTRDDRVHPGHARKMAAKMESYGYPVWYYENIEGGHGGSSTNEQLAERLALVYTHLWTHLK
ncbi:prolyl oligopeptidase [Marinicella pacifica]|uniref:Prolyl oligopeptidase n=1 Tax=Marinicella pacifica TaxID=1171543 RepID=A0A917CQ05_9GAMM|nr:prolyl oligopeptidase family serine peptidase [Marinicella pacifica]GGF94534.1 prolyl oligopeptidase [Marinicella pacifica]